MKNPYGVLGIPADLQLFILDVVIGMGRRRGE